MSAGNGTRPSDALTREQLLAMYESMVLQRRFEEGAARSYGMGKIYGFCHLYIGQEAVSTGCATAMGDDDIMISAYRIHAQALALGVPPQAVMDELYGRATGSVGGMGGSMHIFDIEKGFWGGWGLVGQQIPTATGIAFAQKYLDSGRVTCGFLGDGAMHQGAVHESLNLASIWNLPLVVTVENNHYGMGTAVERISSLPPLHEFGGAYEIAHDSFDGMDVLASYDAYHTAIERARNESKPTFLEAVCSRFRGHSMSDPGKYRTKEELEDEKSRDPIPKLGAVLIDKEFATEDELKDIDKRTKAEVKTILKNAENAAWPDESQIFTNVLADA